MITYSKPQHFHEFFSWNQSCKQLKSPKPQHFHEFFSQRNRQFSREMNVEFLDKKWRFRTVCKKENTYDLCSSESSTYTAFQLLFPSWLSSLEEEFSFKSRLHFGWGGEARRGAVGETPPVWNKFCIRKQLLLVEIAHTLSSIGNKVAFATVSYFHWWSMIWRKWNSASW